MSAELIVNATLIGERLSGLGRYGLCIARRLLARPDTRVFVNSLGVRHFNEIERTRLSVASPRLSPDRGFRGHLVRLLWSNRLRLQRPDSLIFSMSPLEACWVGSRQIVAVHDLIPLLYPGDYRKQYPFFRYVLPGVLRRAARVVTISNATKQQLMDVYRLPERHISVIHHGVEEPFDRTERFPRAGEYLLWVGSSKKSKNLETLLEGYAVLRRAGWRMPLVLVSPGNGRPLPEGIRLVSSASDEDLARLYRGARLLVMPSLAEGFGLPALEAMASGCPVVASNTAALHEVCGDAVAYVEPSSPESIAEGVARLLSDRNLCGRLSRAGRERSVMFSWDRAAKQHCEIFAEVLESSTRGQLK